MKIYLDAMSKYTTFSGRATRLQFWTFIIIFAVALGIAMAIDAALLFKLYGVGILTALVVLIHLLPVISIYVRRLHDINKSGWWYWFNLVPAVGPIMVLVFLCTGSKNEGNRFGTPA